MIETIKRVRMDLIPSEGGQVWTVWTKTCWGGASYKGSGEPKKGQSVNVIECSIERNNFRGKVSETVEVAA